MATTHADKFPKIVDRVNGINWDTLTFETPEAAKIAHDIIASGGNSVHGVSRVHIMTGDGCSVRSHYYNDLHPKFL